MQMIRKNKGITLVALIVTIIILMILAGVVFATVTGNNGILSKSKFARDAYQNSADEENNTLSKYENEIDKSTLDVASSRDSEIEELKAEIEELKKKNNNKTELFSREIHQGVNSGNYTLTDSIENYNILVFQEVFDNSSSSDKIHYEFYYVNELIKNGYPSRTATTVLDNHMLMVIFKTSNSFSVSSNNTNYVWLEKIIGIK